MKANYHTHIYKCKHASGTVEENVIEAINHGFVEIGISDHMPKDVYKDNLYSMEGYELEEYIKEIDEAKQKYKNKIEVLKGMECEYTKDLIPILHKLKYDYKFDYLILGHHFALDENNEFRYFHDSNSSEDFILYKNTVIQALKSGYFNYLAHPDYFLFSYRGKWTKELDVISREIIETCINENIVIELNANGFRRGSIETEDGLRYPYPRKEFWDIVSEYKDAKVIIGSDNHNKSQLNDFANEKAINMATELKLNLLLKI